MLEAKIDVSHFLKIVDTLKEIVREVYFKFSKKGMSIQSMDPAHVAFVTLFLGSDGFDVYKCPRATKCGINLEYFGNILRLSKSPNDKLTIMVDDHAGSKSKSQTQGGPNSMDIRIENERSKREADFSMKLVNFEDDDFKIPKLKSDSLLCMRSADFSHICRDLANISDTVSLGFLKRGINLSVKSDFAQGNISICDNDTMKQEDSKEATDKELMTEVEAGEKNVVQFFSQMSIDEKDAKEFSLKYINIFNKGECFSPIIKIHLSTENKDDTKDPMIMEFKISDIGEVKFYLAQKITE